MPETSTNEGVVTFVLIASSGSSQLKNTPMVCILHELDGDSWDGLTAESLLAWITYFCAWYVPFACD